MCKVGQAYFFTDCILLLSTRYSQEISLIIKRFYIGFITPLTWGLGKSRSMVTSSLTRIFGCNTGYVWRLRTNFDDYSGNFPNKVYVELKLVLKLTALAPVMEKLAFRALALPSD